MSCSTANKRAVAPGSSANQAKPEEVPSRYFQQFFDSLPPMHGKVVAITGCTSGTGLAAATAVARKGAEVVMLNRPSERAVSAERAVRAAAPGAVVSTVACDLSSFDSVRAAAKQARQQFPDGIDVLCNNAGVMALPDVASDSGHDVQMKTNHLSHFLLTNELLPQLERAAELRGEARVVSMTSEARKLPGTPMKAEYYGKNGGNLGGDGNGFLGVTGPRWERYHQSKLANCLFTYALHDRLAARNSKVKALLAHPGFSATNLQITSSSSGGIGQGVLGGFIYRMMKGMAMSPEDGAMGLLMCICQEGVSSGDFYGPKGRGGLVGPAVKLQPEALLTDPKAKQIMWEESSKAVRIDG